MNHKWNWTLETLVAVVVLAALGAGCDSPISDVSDMKNSTTQMAQTTQAMSTKTTDLDTKTNDLDSKTKQLLDLTGVLDTTILNTYTGLRLGNTAQLRDGANMLTQMDQATTLEAKAAYATVYYETYEYQLWTGQQSDTTQFLDNQYLQAVQEFDREVTQYVPSDLTDIDPTSTSNKMLNLYALSIAMHMTNELEVNQPVLPNDSAGHTAPYHISMLDLVESSLRAAHAVYEGQMDDGAETDWQHEGASNQELFQALIQTRENFLAVMNLAKISNIAKSSGFLGIPGLTRKLEMLYSRWDSMIPSLNIDQINQYDTWIAESNNDRDFLKSVGADASIYESVHKIYSNMNQPSADAVLEDANAAQKKAALARTQAGEKLWNDIQNMIKG